MNTVSYTHLDVYKRQEMWHLMKHNISISQNQVKTMNYIDTFCMKMCIRDRPTITHLYYERNKNARHTYLQYSVNGWQINVTHTVNIYYTVHKKTNIVWQLVWLGLFKSNNIYHYEIISIVLYITAYAVMVFAVLINTDMKGTSLSFFLYIRCLPEVLKTTHCIVLFRWTL